MPDSQAELLLPLDVLLEVLPDDAPPPLPVPDPAMPLPVVPGITAAIAVASISTAAPVVYKMFFGTLI